MPEIRFLPSQRTIVVSQGTNLLEACHQAGIGVPASCGGKGVCGKCRVRITAGQTAPHAGHEAALSPAELAAGWRLACLVEVASDLTVQTDEGAPLRNVILTDFAGRPAVIDHSLRAVPLNLPAPTLQDQTCDLGRIMTGLGLSEYPRCALPLLQRLPGLLRRNNYQLTAVLSGTELLGVERYAEAPRPCGLAVDIGTTTLAGALIDLADGSTLAVASRTNPQAQRGDDVVSRIDHAAKNPQALAELQRLVVEAINSILQETCALAGREPENVYLLTAAGNTTMHHLLLGIEPAAIAQAPFVACVRRGLALRARHVGLRAGHGARLHALPNVSAYVGGDIVAGLLAQEVHDSPQTLLFIDVGTNGEMALRSGGATYACSTAAGPAFEGARISCGMRAATGAIRKVSAEAGDIAIATVDDAPPRGLCGTGLLDAVAALLELGVIDETGRLLDADELTEERPDASPALLARLTETDAGAAIVLAEAGPHNPRLTLTQRDIREFQLAKGAIAAGVSVMLAHAGIEAAQIDRVLLAGGFGNYLDPASACRVGMLPAGLTPAKVSFVGNSSLAGARLCLLAESMRQDSERIAREVRYLELSGRPDFQAAFAEAMTF